MNQRIEVMQPAEVGGKYRHQPRAGKPKGPKMSEVFVERLGGWRPNKYGLSVREVQVLELHCEGLSCAEIGRRINLCVKTVSTYGTRIREKMEARNIIQAILKWDRETWVRPEPITPEEVLRFILGREPHGQEREINFRNWQENPKVYANLEQVAREKREAERANNGTQQR